MYLTNDSIDNIAMLIEHGKVILYPTDTIWGIGCDATNIHAVEKVISIKGRSPEKGFVVLVDSIEMLKNYIRSIHPKIETLLGYHKRPLTVIYPEAKNLPNIVCAPDGSVGIRVTHDEFCKELIWATGKPLVSSSANISGHDFPTHFGNISKRILQSVDYVVNYRQDDLTPSEPSVIVKMTNKKELEFLR